MAQTSEGRLHVMSVYQWSHTQRLLSFSEWLQIIPADYESLTVMVLYTVEAFT